MNQSSAAPESSRIFASPVGPLTLVARGGALRAVLFPRDGGRPVAAAGPPSPRSDAASDPDEELLVEAARQLAEHFDGDRRRFELPLALAGTPFQRRVWAELRTIPYGETVSYGELARRIGAPGEAREVGSAVGRTPTPIVVPCHRVIGADGALVGYGGGLPRKRALLDLELGVLPLGPVGNEGPWPPTETPTSTPSAATTPPRAPSRTPAGSRR
ncbi:MAG: methylated-DNA--[protein]-cysteine S-methyltransferase [Solirubrobacterales bacterium]